MYERTRLSDDRSTDEAEDLDAIQRDLEKIIYETLSPAQAEAYVARLRQLLNELRGTTFSPEVVSSDVPPSEAGATKAPTPDPSDPS
jgi:hypothetical protein